MSTITIQKSTDGNTFNVLVPGAAKPIDYTCGSYEFGLSDNDGTVIFKRSDGTFVIPEGYLPTNIKNGDTGVAFTDYDALRAYCVANFFRKAGGTPAFAQTSTYSAMKALSPATSMRTVKVLNDENKGLTNTIYQLWPDGVIMWIAANKED